MKITNNKELESLIGKRVKAYNTGLLVEGTVIEAKEDDYCYFITLEHTDTPVYWGDQVFTKTSAFQNKHNGGGSMKYAEIV